MPLRYDTLSIAPARTDTLSLVQIAVDLADESTVGIIETCVAGTGELTASVLMTATVVESAVSATDTGTGTVGVAGAVAESSLAAVDSVSATVGVDAAVDESSLDATDVVSATVEVGAALSESSLAAVDTVSAGASVTAANTESASAASESIVVDSGIPLVISPNSILTVRADVGVTVAGTDVTAVADQSGNAHDYGNAGSGTYVQYDAATWGLPVLTGTSGSTRLVGAAAVATALLGNDNAFTIFGLFYRPSASFFNMWGVGDAAPYIKILAAGLDRLQISAIGSTGTAKVVNTPNGSLGVGWHAFAIRCNGTTVDIFIDSTTAVTTGAAFDADDKAGGTPGHTLFAAPPNSGGACSVYEWEICTGASSAPTIAAKMNSMLASKAAM